MKLMIPAVLLLTVASVHAQTAVYSPAHFERAEAPNSSNLPLLSPYSTNRLLQVHDDLKGKAMTVKSLSFRLDSYHLSKSTRLRVPGFSIFLSGLCSTAATTATTMNATFSKNHGTDKKTVISTKLLKFPATFYSTARRFEYTVPFDKPFVFGGKGGLCWEIAVTGTTFGLVGVLDAAAGAGNSNPPIMAMIYGTGCRISKSSRNAFSLSIIPSTPNWGTGTNQIRFLGSNAQPNQPIVLVLGASADRFGAYNLPYLLPGTRTAETGPCYVYTDIILAYATLPKGSNYDLNMTFPLRKELNGVSTFWQAYSMGVAKSPWNFVTSNAYYLQWIAPYGLAPIGSVSLRNTTGSVGAVQKNYGAVVKFN